VVRVAACGICGSDLGYVALGGVGGPTPEPIPLGHELAGVVEAVGADVPDLKVGSRVVVNPIAADNQIGNGGPEGAFASHLLVRNAGVEGVVMPIPDELPLDLAALAEPLGVGLRSVERAGAQPGEKVVVFGAGPIGLSALVALRFRGVDDVISVDRSARRLEIARELGARETVNPSTDDLWGRLRELHGTEPVMGAPMLATDAYIEASGASVLIGETLQNAKSQARVSVVALHRAEVPVSFLLLMLKEIRLVGSMAYPTDWSEAFEILTSMDLRPMITHRFPLERFDDALAVARDPAAGAKVLIETR
jgi:threonine dehydrogenase-like Zn-dependent dehydrogenase